jgi:hypothetical protein
MTHHIESSLPVYRLWDVLDMIVELGDCDVYSFNPDMDDDPMGEEGSM